MKEVMIGVRDHQFVHVCMHNDEDGTCLVGNEEE